MTCRIVEEYGNERVAEAKNEFVESLLHNGRLSLEEIAAIAKVPLERVRQMVERLAAHKKPPESAFQSAAWSQGIFAPDQIFFAVHGSSGSAQKGWDGASPSGRNTASHR